MVLRGRLEPTSHTPRSPRHINGNAITFKPSIKIQDSGIPKDDAPVNLMQLLRKDLTTPGGRDSPSSSILLTVNTPPQLYNVRETDTHAPNPANETAGDMKNYHVLGGADQQDYGELPLDDDRSMRTPVMVLPIKRPGLAVMDEEYDDYDDDDDDLMIDTPGRSSLVAATQGMFGEDALCPVTRLPGIAEDTAILHRSNVGGRKASDCLISSGNANIVFLNEDGDPLPPRTPTPPEPFETTRDKNSKRRVRVHIGGHDCRWN
ncbi:uncharacterized protein LOC106013034 [Aplysia californica]|uniref:Uncharacterized protein LOC106013034 n=1 Tax=Aplysia californica TaxID=6500 RepID=A0ABM1A930_APLCA|nr:uncharacterized protein LOC106013034 [Aplysia californica]